MSYPGGGPSPYYQDCLPKFHGFPPLSHRCCPGGGVANTTTLPTSFFQAALAQNLVFSNVPTPLVPWVLLTGNSDQSFDVDSGAFVAPALGFYRFDFTATVLYDDSTNLAGATEATLSLLVQDLAQGSREVSLNNVVGTFPVGAATTQSLSGSLILQLLPGQRVTLAVTTSTAVSATALGTAAPGAPPYFTTFGGQALISSPP